jgi:hypothetical protein
LVRRLTSPDETQAGSERGALSLSEYIAEADRICADGRVKARARLAPLGRRAQRDGKVTVDEVMEINRAAVHEVTPMMRRLEALPKPRENSARSRRTSGRIATR